MYADDIVMLAPNEVNAQKQLDIMTEWCGKWGMHINPILKKLKNMGIATYETLYDSYVNSIMNYGAAVWGYAEQNEPQVLQNRIQRYYLGVNKYTPTAATRIEFGWLDPKYQRWIDIIRYWNRLLKMKENRIPVIIYKWDKSLKQNCWVDQVKQILQYCNLYDCMLKNVPCDLEVLEARLKVLNRNRWWLEANDKPKL